MLISFLRHIGEGIEPLSSLRGVGAQGSVSSRAETGGDSPQSPHAFVFQEGMSKRELRALVGVEDTESLPPEPQPELEPERTEGGHAEAARLALL